jgi:FlaG/FlaF family flagellin (archaellin)
VNFKKNQHAVSYVIGVILMVAIVVSLAAVISLLLSQTVETDEDVLPMVGLSVNTDSEDPQKALIFIETVVLNKNTWNQTEFVLVDITYGIELINDTDIKVTLPPNSEKITSGDAIVIEKFDPKPYLIKGNEYRFTLNKKNDNSMMGTITWTQ